MNTSPDQNTLTTADLAARGSMPAARRTDESKGDGEGAELTPLFPEDVAEGFRARWTAVQSGFVDDPRQAVRQGDELVAQVMKTLAESFSNQRGQLEAQLDQTDKVTTENLRLALRRYRSFFERLLSL